METQIREIVENFPDLLSWVRGDQNRPVSDLQTGATASTGSLIFVSTRPQLREAAASKAQTWVVAKDLLEGVPAEVPNVVASPNPTLALSRVGARYFPQTRNHQILAGPAIHPSAQIANTAKIGVGCVIGPGAVIGEHCEIGARTRVGANTVIEPHTKLGEACVIHPLVFIAHSCEIGARVEIKPQSCIGGEGFGYAQDQKFNHYRVTHYGRVVLEDDVHVGAGVQIDRGTFGESRIGAGTKIDNHCHFAHNIQVGRNTLITGGMITAGSATIGSNCVFGGRTTMKGHTKVVDRTQFGGLSVIGNDILEPGQYGGFPALELNKEMRIRASQRQLPDLIKQVRKIMKHLGLEK